MLVRIGSRGSGDDAPRGVVPRLEDCHARIRRFTATARTLAGATGARDDDVREAAAGCISYFGRALPHHSGDEDESIAPRIDRTTAVNDMVAQHIAIHAVLDELMPLWKRVEAEPAELVAVQPELARLSDDLAAKFDEHLSLEEREVFPLIAALPDDVQAEIIDEMAARRG